MGDIPWTDKTWNPVVGCSRVSAGCENCYAERFIHRGLRPEHQGLTVMGKSGPRWNGVVTCLPERIEQPLRWRKPRKIFVNSVSDLFHEEVPDEFIDRVFGVMALTPWHTYQVLTKRPERMRAYMGGTSHAGTRTDPLGRWIDAAARTLDAMKRAPLRAHAHFMDELDGPSFPLPNVWLVVSVENQPTADERIPLLLQTPAAVRGVSYEPALGPVGLDCYLGELPEDEDGAPYSGKLDWIIVGGESGPGARPFDVEWARSTIRQCREAGVACFVKQLGARPYAGSGLGDEHPWNLRNRKGAEPSEWPEDLRVREFPT